MKNSIFTSRLVYFSPLGKGPKGAGEAAEASPQTLYDRADKAIAYLNSTGDTNGADRIAKLVQDHKKLRSTPVYNIHDSIEDANVLRKRLDRVDRRIAQRAKPDEDIYAGIDDAEDKGNQAIAAAMPKEAVDESPQYLYDRADKAIVYLKSIGNTNAANSISKQVQAHKKLRSTPGYNLNDSIDEANALSERLDRVDRNRAA